MAETAGRVTLWGIEVFLAVAEERSISAAARRLSASVSAVSQQLSGLEAALGASLFDRSARPLALTLAGDLFRRRARAILDEAEQARAELAAADLSRLTRFRLGMIEDFDADVTPRLLTGMAGSLTGTRFLLETGPSHRLYDQLDARALDVIVTAEMGPPADGLEVHPLMQEPFVAAVPRGMAGGVETLAALPLVLYTPRHHMGRQIAAHLLRENLTPAYRFELDSYHAIMAMVAAGEGWTILTPLGVLYARRFVEAVEIHPLPGAPLLRRIVLSARKGALGEIGADVAERLKPLIDELIVGPTVAQHSFLKDALKLL